jgi:hypothetical protein
MVNIIIIVTFTIPVILIPSDGVPSIDPELDPGDHLLVLVEDGDELLLL